MIGIVTDSNAQLPPELVERYQIEVVPLTVVVDGTEYAEGVDLDADAFYAHFEGGNPTVSTSQPIPGRFAEAYARVAERGATEILSIHIGADVSGTLNSARVATGGAPVPVRLVDTGTASFGVACCVWEAAEAIAQGASLAEAAELAEQLGTSVGNVFVVRALDLARAGGRLVVEDGPGLAPDDDGPDDAPIPVLSLVKGEIRSVGQARDVAEAARVMADFVALAGESLKVAVGIADRGAEPIWLALEDALAGVEQVQEVVRYRIGPSVGAHTGPGTAGAFFYPAPQADS
ncbi:DegV family protein [soil metagenome]